MLVTFVTLTRRKADTQSLQNVRQRSDNLMKFWFVKMIMKILLWFILLVICWPLALAILFLYPLIWLVLLPFRILGFAVEGVFAFIRALFMLPARVLS